MNDEIIKGLSDEVKNVAARLDKTPTIEDFQKSMEATEKATADAQAVKEQLGVIGNDLDGMRKMLEHNLGKSGAQDLNREIDLFVKACWHRKMNKSMPTWLEKAAADYVTDVDAQGGWHVPSLVANEVIKVVLRHGQIWPQLAKVTLPAGNTMRVPNEVTLASTIWTRRTQGSSLTEMDPAVVWGGDTLNPQFVHGYVKIANEVFTAQGISIPQELSMQLMTQVVRRIENGVIAGYVGTPTLFTGRTAPHNGVLHATNVYEQSAAATVTMALISKFIGESIDDHEGCGDTDEYCLVTTDVVGQTLKGVLTQQGQNWGDVAQGVFPRLHGYRFFTTPHAKKANPTATRNHIILTPLNKILVGWSGNFMVDFNDRGAGWTENETYLKVGTYADFSIGNPYMHSYARFTDLA